LLPLGETYSVRCRGCRCATGKAAVDNLLVDDVIAAHATAAGPLGIGRMFVSVLVTMMGMFTTLFSISLFVSVAWVFGFRHGLLLCAQYVYFPG
jgi:hypothetical protein